jgi:hypothetical protein
MERRKQDYSISHWIALREKGVLSINSKIGVGVDGSF